MKYRISTVILLIMTLFLLSLPVSATEQTVNRMTPYDTYADPDTFLNGAVLDLKKSGDVKGWITRELENMRYCYNINTINLYGLEEFDDGDKTDNKDFLFSELARLGMKAVVRIESYNGATFAFREADLDSVMNNYDKLICYVSGDGKRQQVAYFALNMPVDDGLVQNNLGGVNSALSKQRQVSYATSFVRRMREVTSNYGFKDAKMYLSIFYGWDNSYYTPSYAPAGADGYFMNNYSYPVNAHQLPDASASDGELINQNRLMVSMVSYLSQYKGKPLIIESGFHTLEYNNGVVTNQTAGLVKDKEAKIKAMKATLKFYQSYFSEFKGWLYFGYNLYKEEGNPPAVMDWSLVYPTKGQVEAEEGYRIGGAVSISDTLASDGTAVMLTNKGDGLSFYECASLNQIKIRYKTDKNVSLGVYVDDTLKKTLELKPTDGYVDEFLSLTVIKGSHMQLKLESKGTMTVDAIGAYEYLEAENAALQGGASVTADEQASNGLVVTGISSDNDRITMKGIRGGARVKLRYKAESDCVVKLTVNGGITSEMTLKASPSYRDMSVSLNVPIDPTLEIKGISGDGLFIDYIGLSGVARPEETSYNKDDQKGGGLSPIVIVILCLAAFLAVVAAVTIVLLKRPQPKQEERK